MELWLLWKQSYENSEIVAVCDRLEALSRDHNGFANSALLLAEHAYLSGYVDFRYLGKIDRASKSIDLAASLFDYVREPSRRVQTLVLQAALRKSSGGLSSALVSARAALATATELMNPQDLAISLVQYVIGLYRTGRFNEALKASQTLVEVSRLLTSPKWELHSELAAARIHLLRGDALRAQAHLDAATEHAKGTAIRRMQGVFHEYRAQLSLLSGNAEESLQLLAEAQNVLEDSKTTSYELAELNLRRAEAFLALGKYHDVISECEVALERLERVGEGLERGHVLRVMALAKHSLGRPTEAAELFEWAERELRHVGDIFELGKLLVDKAELSQGDAEARVADAAEAVNLLQRVGVEKEIGRARDVLSLTQTVLRRQNSIRIHHEDHDDHRIIAESESTQALLADAKVCGRSGAPALITGETGVGKEIFARYIHDHSERAKKAFVAVNCAAVPETLFEREFFGHSKGAFTGADSDREGLLEAADGGTLFLDEIGELPLPMQSKLLRVLQDGSFRRVGETREREVDLRIIAATNRSLEEQVKLKTFREDLYYRIAWFEFEIPPLRERPEDLSALARFFLAHQSRRMEMTYWIDKFAWAALRRYAWPGNIRELESTIGAGCARAGADGCIQVEHLPPRVAKEQPLREQPDSDLNLAVALEKKERELIMEALQRTGHQRTAAARLLGIGRNTLYDKMKRLIVDPEAAKRSDSASG